MTARIIHGDCRQVLRELPEASMQCVVTSPPYCEIARRRCERAEKQGLLSLEDGEP